MASPPNPPTSFSTGRRWSILFSVVTSTAAVIALVAMVNYLGARHYARFNVGDRAATRLAPQTLGLLKSLTNEVAVVVYYNKDDPLYTMITGLLKEYRFTNPRISLEFIDPVRDAGPAQKLKARFGPLLAAQKDIVIFSCGDQTRALQGKLLGGFTLEPVAAADGQQQAFERRPSSFAGERYFNAALLAVVNPRPLKACFLTGHAEHDPASPPEDNNGYSRFTEILGLNNVKPEFLLLNGTNTVPTNCNLLIIAGPKTALAGAELGKIKDYLAQGGRMLVLFNSFATPVTGLESLLEGWGVSVGANRITEPQESTDMSENELVVRLLYNRAHPLVSPLYGYGLQMVAPRSVGALKTRNEPPDAPKADVIAYSGGGARINGVPVAPNQQVPLIVAVQKERSTTRLLVLGDSLCLDNHYISSEQYCNYDFAALAVNWLLDRTELMEGVSARPVTEYRLTLTNAEQETLEWMFLGAMPGGILALGGLVWLRRRH